MRIVITGGNGYVGRTLSRLLYKEHQVFVIDNLRFGSLRFQPEELKLLHFEQIDICNPHAVRSTIEQIAPDVLIHLAAIHFIPECESKPQLAVATNVQGTLHLLTACPPNCRFVFASSGAVYQPQEVALVEDRSPVQPNDIYGFTKQHGEDYVRYLANQRGFSAVIVRLFNVIGPGETNPHILPEIIAQLKAGHKILQLGNLKAKRDYINVEDAARGFAAAALKGKLTSNETVTVNLGTHSAYSVEDILTSLQQLTGIGFSVSVDPSRLRKMDRPLLLADYSKMQQLFGWTPQIDLITTLQMLWQNPDLPAYLTEKYTR